MRISDWSSDVCSSDLLFPGTNKVKSMTASAGGVPTGNQNVVTGKTDTYQAGTGFIWKRDGLKITGDVAFTDSTYTRQTRQFNYSQIGRASCRERVCQYV